MSTFNKMYLPPPITVLIAFLFFPLRLSSSQVDDSYRTCLPYQFNCANIANVTYPFLTGNRSSLCGYPQLNLTCQNNSPLVNIESLTYTVKKISYPDRIITVVETDYLATNCPLPASSTNIGNTSFELGSGNEHLHLLLNCSNPDFPPEVQEIHCLRNYFRHRSYALLKRFENTSVGTLERGNCTERVKVEILKTGADELSNNSLRYGEVMNGGFEVKWRMGAGWCTDCVHSGGICGYNTQVPEETTCYCRDRARFASCPVPGRKADTRKKIIIGVSAGAGSFILAWLLFHFLQFYRRKRLLQASSTLLSRDISPDPSSKPDLDKCHSTNYAIATHIFSYKELQEATNNFDSTRELGDGGFGTVYYGKLRDGRSVAVKRLYDNNSKRVELFMNEVKILSGLRHQNLVSLYGCTSRRSRELLLVYEFIPNGTLADHLHGDRAKDGALTWPIRMSIAMETAEALAYLHAVEPPIIHRDVKTNNILLDSNFRVKVADFGLSRLIPADVTHVSTTPQGTPGYVDPDYSRCYQLTEKSDVYSFGVVLMELVSSMPAVDIRRHRHEINLATLAVNRIHSRALHELVDPSLGYGSDGQVTRMMKLTAELAFRCLQEEKDMRPSMEEVLAELKNMEETEEFGVEKKEKPEVDSQNDDLHLLNGAPFSPDSVMENWDSKLTTPNTSK